MFILSWGQQHVLEDLYANHPGIVRIKNLARSFIWRPGIDTDIKERGKSCEVCQLHIAVPSAAHLHLWKSPSP